VGRTLPLSLTVLALGQHDSPVQYYIEWEMGNWPQPNVYA
jgi:hypothetical protein